MGSTWSSISLILPSAAVNFSEIFCTPCLSSPMCSCKVPNCWYMACTVFVHLVWALLHQRLLLALSLYVSAFSPHCVSDLPPHFSPSP
ncbi:hypothetical protein GDO78_019384 [Eleutherodactylus coqui]|uniref:Uncharacterized protein n=1 Tax=Eleutherodactylus coqui TaxID=57060 RepID=A0A8J6E909_ELECQ|nr:hypothetical protein GDO78_019384 [Eleutherodactylus coqui]